MIEIERKKVVAATPEAEYLAGGPATGKTTALAQRALQAAAANDGEVLAVCASEQGARRFRLALDCAASETHADAAERIEVMTVHELALEVLADGGAERFNRDPHILTKQEMREFTEDMRTTTLKRKRLREIAAFLECGWSRLDDDDPGWIITTEEELVIDLIHRTLGFTGGMLPAEVGPLAFKTLRMDDAVAQRHMRDHVLVDGYHLLGRASQALANRLARRSIVIAADEAPGLPADDPYPWFEGVEEFLEANPQAKTTRLAVCHRPQDVVGALNRLRGDAFESCGELASDDERTVIRSRYPKNFSDEFEAIADELRSARDAGAASAFVAGTNGMWRGNLLRFLRAQGLDARNAHAGARTPKDPAEAALARLAADPDDACAWRTWVGCGDELLRSASVGELRDVAEPQGLRLHEALALLSRDELPGASLSDPLYKELLAVYEEGLRQIEARRGSGQAEAAGPQGAESQVGPTSEGGDDAPRFEVLVGAPIDARGREFDVVVFGGFVNGLIPSRDYFDPSKLVGESRRRAHVSDIQHVCLPLAASRSQVVFTGFQKAGLETAEKLEVSIKRISALRGEPTATTTPSELLALVDPAAEVLQ